MKTLKYIHVFFLCSMLSCTNEKRINYIEITNFPETINLLSEKIQTSPNLYCVAGLLLMDSVAITLDMKNDIIFQLLKRPYFNNIGAFINRGQGPDEEIFIDPYIQPIGDNKFLYKNLSSVKVVTFDSTMGRLIQLDELSLPSELAELWHIFKIDNKIIGCKTDELTEKEFISYDIVTKKVESFGEAFPSIDKYVRVNESDNNRLFVKANTLKPDKSEFACVYDKFPILRIYSADGVIKKDVRLQNNQTFPYALIEENPSEESIGEIMQNYRMVKSTNDFIYALYVGKKTKDLPPGLNDFSNEIHVWDWNGSPVSKLLLDQNIFTFDVDKNNSFLICSSLESIDVLYKYELKDGQIFK